MLLHNAALFCNSQRVHQKKHQKNEHGKTSEKQTRKSIRKTNTAFTFSYRLVLLLRRHGCAGEYPLFHLSRPSFSNFSPSAAAPTDISCVATEELRNFQRRVKLKRSRTDLQDIQACSPPLRCDKPVACMHPEIRPEIDRSLFGRKLVNSSSAVIDSIDSNDSRCCESFIIVSLQFD